MAAVATNHTNGIEKPKITFYTNHGCPYAHRADITLQELGLPYEEVIIDLNTPRPQWYLDINPRGLVPSIKYSNGALNDEILYESNTVSQFLIDSTPNHLLPAPTDGLQAALFRSRAQFFVDTWNSKVSIFPVALAEFGSADQDEKCKQLVESVKKELEPFLKDANPFFGGSKEITYVETQIAPFLARLYLLCNDEIAPVSLKERLNALPNFSKWVQATINHPSVQHQFNGEKILEGTKARLAKIRAQSK